MQRPCASSTLHSQPLPVIFLDRGAKTLVGRKTGTYMVASAPQGQDAPAGQSRQQQNDGAQHCQLAGTFPQIIKEVFLFRPQTLHN